MGNDYPARDTEAVQVDRGDGTKGRRGKKCEKLNKSKYTCIENFFFWDFDFRLDLTFLSFCRPNVKTISALWPNCLKKSCSYAELTPTSPNVAITHSR